MVILLAVCIPDLPEGWGAGRSGYFMNKIQRLKELCSERREINDVIFDSTIHCGNARNFIKKGENHYSFRGRVDKSFFFLAFFILKLTALIYPLNFYWKRVTLISWEAALPFGRKARLFLSR